MKITFRSYNSLTKFRDQSTYDGRKFEQVDRDLFDDVMEYVQNANNFCRVDDSHDPGMDEFYVKRKNKKVLVMRSTDGGIGFDVKYWVELETLEKYRKTTYDV